jgi:hypothetical protein
MDERAVSLFKRVIACSVYAKAKGKRGREEEIDALSTHWLELAGESTSTTRADHEATLKHRNRKRRLRAWRNEAPDVFDLMKNTPLHERDDLVHIIKVMKDSSAREALIAQLASQDEEEHDVSPMETEPPKTEASWAFERAAACFGETHATELLSELDAMPNRRASDRTSDDDLDLLVRHRKESATSLTGAERERLRLLRKSPLPATRPTTS